MIERFSEMLVIVALTGVGLSLNRPIGLRSWGPTWRLLGVTMPLSIAAFALGGWLIGLPIAVAVLLGAALAPTDPVLAGDVQAPPPLEGRSGRVRFALTSEAGFNDGLAFPFTNLALALAAAAATGEDWFWPWLGYDVFYQVAAGIAGGWLIGYATGYLTFGLEPAPGLARAGQGLVALSVTLIAYAATELIGGYGFLAVFVAALTLRQRDPHHEYHRRLHGMIHDMEQLLMSLFLLLLGGAVVGGALAPLTWQAVVAGLVFVLLVRPLAGLAGLVGSRLTWRQQGVVSFFGIRGIGSVYYLAYGLNRHAFENEGLLWALTIFVILVSITVHGITAAPAMKHAEGDDEQGPADGRQTSAE